MAERPFPDHALFSLGGQRTAPVQPSRSPADRALVPALLQAARKYDMDSVDRLLMAEWHRTTPLSFLQRRICPLLLAIGQAWEAGRIEIRHERILTRYLESLLRTLRQLGGEQRLGPLVVMATLPGERHSLGLQVAGLVLSEAGCQALEGGVELPVTQLAQLATELRAAAVAISISAATGGNQSSEMLWRLRQCLLPSTALLVGGAGARARSSLEVITDLEELAAWGRDLALRRAS